GRELSVRGGYLAAMTPSDDFRRLHAEGVLVLPNAWDAASARLVERAGAAAVATTSGAVAWSLGVPDGDRLPLELLAGAVERIAAAVAVPVTADVESGGPDVAETVRAVLAAGAVGINIEDGGGAVELHRDRVYAEAGADGIFVPGVTDLDLLRTLVAEIPLPVNVLTGPHAPTVDEFAAVGVRRVSVGTGLAQAAYAAADRAARELLATGTYRSLEDALSYGELQKLLD